MIEPGTEVKIKAKIEAVVELKTRTFVKVSIAGREGTIIVPVEEIVED